MKTILLIIFFLYLSPSIICLIGIYLHEFKGKTIEDFMFFLKKKEHETDVTNLTFVMIPLLNIIAAIFYLIKMVMDLFALPFVLANKKYNIWNKIKKINIK